MNANDLTEVGATAQEGLESALAGKEPEEERSPEYWLNRLKNKNDDIGGYEGHAEVMAKYIVEAYEANPSLADCPNSTVYQQPIDWNNLVVLQKDLSDVLSATVYTDPQHPFRRALNEATGFTWGWAYNIARYACGYPPQPNPAIIMVGA